VVAASHRSRVKLAALEKQLDGWDVIEKHHLAKTFRFPDFAKPSSS
jgi:pterin-4a-carbinolamine dehydratase